MWGLRGLGAGDEGGEQQKAGAQMIGFEHIQLNPFRGDRVALYTIPETTMKPVLLVLTAALLAPVLVPAADTDRKHIVFKRATPAADSAPFSEGVLVGNT